MQHTYFTGSNLGSVSCNNQGVVVTDLCQEEIVEFFSQESTSFLIEILPSPSLSAFSNHGVGWIIWAHEGCTTIAGSCWPPIGDPFRVHFFTAAHI